MSMKELLQERKDSIFEKWLDRVIMTYPSESSNFFKNKKNRFDNPIGSTLNKELPILLDALINLNDLDEVSNSIDEIVRIRAVQEFSAAQAVGFLLLLKKVIREELDGKTEISVNVDDWWSVEDKIDRMVFMAFDIYMSCKEKIFEIRSRSFERQTYVLDKMAERAAERSDKGEEMNAN
ncbi:MAG: RsbRD N-terminal domain-containing protein [Candidatus Electryonea clarkiae]|nr:RsbRD N-terminal domain-containing protein [Candidatus Electryonea clarkiae]MDP8288356.1 RsbRD N-terminal domain-containing protein [Candidatus Electryonea clarkiae]